MCASRALSNFGMIVLLALAATPGWADAFADARKAYRAPAKLSQYGPALEKAKATLAIAERDFGPNHRKVALVLNDMASYELALGRHDSAIALLKRALAIRVDVFGPDSTMLAGTYSDLAEAQIAAGRPSDGATTVERMIALLEAKDGPGNKSLAEPLTMLAHARAAQGQYESAFTVIDRALGFADKLRKSQLRTLMAGTEAVAARFYNAGRYDLSRPLHEEAIPGLANKLGPAAAPGSSWYEKTNRFLYDALAGNTDPDDAYVQVPFDRSGILFGLRDAQDLPIRASYRDLRVGVIDVAHSVTAEQRLVIILGQADENVEIEREGTYAPEWIIDQSGFQPIEIVQWLDGGTAEASFATLSYRTLTAGAINCITFGGTFAPTSRVQQSKEIGGLYCNPPRVPLSADQIARVIASLGIRGYAEPMVN